MILEMMDGEPPYFSEPPLQAMRKLRDMDPPITRTNEEVSAPGSFFEFKAWWFWKKKINLKIELDWPTWVFS